MALCIMVIARVASIPLWMKSKPWAGFFSNSYPCFCGPWSSLALYQTMLENFIFELICFRFIYQTWFVITFIRTLMMKSICELYVIRGKYVESCTILVVCWLNQDPSLYSTDYRVYMGSSMIVRPLMGYYCTCALINWMVLLWLASEQDSTLITTCVFKTKVFVFQLVFRNL